MDYPRLWGKFLRVTTPFAVGLNPHDLHALSTPPAFILSQDQTLNESFSFHPDITSGLLLKQYENFNKEIFCLGTKEKMLKIITDVVC
jgi:hypothetical protein